MANNYIKNRWNYYDDSKSFAENLANDAIITYEKAQNIEQGIYNANRVIEVGIVRVAKENEVPNISIKYNKDNIVMDYILPHSEITSTDMAKIIQESQSKLVDVFSRVYVGPSNENIDGNNNDIMLILSKDGQSIEYIRTFTKNIDGTVSHNDLKLKVDISSIVTDDEHQFITNDDREKLDNIEYGANKYVHPTGDGNFHVPANGTTNRGKHLTAGENPGEYSWESITREEITSALGYTPADPSKITYNKADAENDGLMSKEHFTKLNGIEDGANNYTHPDTHPASMIEEDENHRFITDVEKALLYYTNNDPTLSDHGGIAAGTTFDNKPLSEIIGDILYPYIQPSASCSVTTPSNGGTFEVGVGATITKVRVNVTKKSKPIKLIEIFGTDDLTKALVSNNNASEIANGGTFDFNINKVLSTLTSNLRIRAKITDQTDKSVTVDSGAFNVIYPIYYGSIASDGIVDANLVKNLTKKLEVKGNKSIKYTCDNQKMLFAYPASYGDLSTIIDPNNFNVTDTFIKTVVNITCADGTGIDYNVYVNDASSVTDFTMNFKY